MNKPGRKTKSNPRAYRHVFRLTEKENARFLSLYDNSGMSNRSGFIVSVIFGREIKTVRIDKAALDYYIELTRLYKQFQAVGVNYNQVVKILYGNLSEKKAASLLYRLEKQTVEMAGLFEKIIKLTKEFESKHLHT